MLQLGIFFAVTIGSLTLLVLVLGRTPTRARFRERLDEEFSSGAEGAPGPLYKTLDIWDSVAESGPAAPGSDDPARRGTDSWHDRGEEFLRQAGVRLTLRQALGAAAGLGLVAGLVGFVCGGPALGAAAGAAGALGPLAVVNLQRNARRERYTHQLVGAFELMGRVLRAGQSVTEAFRAAVDAFDDPLAGEFGRCLHQIEHGLRPEVAFRELSQRAGVLELRIFVVAMTIQRQSGGNLSEVLDRLALVVRTRLRLRQKIRALTAEGRMQSLTLTVLPVLAFGAMYVLNREYAAALLEQWRLLLATVGCMGVGTLWIRNIMNFEG